MRLISKTELALAKMVDVDSPGFGLDCLNVLADRTEMSTLHFAVRVYEKAMPQVEDFPVPQDGPLNLTMPEGGLLVHKDDALEALKSIPAPKDTRHLPILAHAVVGMNGAGPKVASTDLSRWSVTNCKKQEAIFPSLDRVWPKGDVTAEITFDAAKLAEILTFMAKHGQGARRAAAVTISLHGSDHAFEINSTCFDRNIQAILMPMRK